MSPRYLVLEYLLPSHIADVTLEGEVQVVEQLGHETDSYPDPAIRQNLGLPPE